MWYNAEINGGFTLSSNIVFPLNDDNKHNYDDRYEPRTHMPFDGITGRVPDTPDSQGKNDNIGPNKYATFDIKIIIINPIGIIWMF